VTPSLAIHRRLEISFHRPAS